MSLTLWEMRIDSLVLLERDHDLIVLEHVPDPVGVDDVVKRSRGQITGQVADLTFSRSWRTGIAAAGSAAEVDDLLLGVREVANHILGAASKISSSSNIEFADLFAASGSVIEAVIDQAVHQVTGTAGEEFMAEVSSARQRLEEVLDRRNPAVRQVTSVKSGPTKMSISPATQALGRGRNRYMTTRKRQSGYSSIFGRWLCESTSSMSRAWKSKFSSSRARFLPPGHRC